MVEKILYQSSLPRAGSTLLQNILAQNPNIYATPTSGLVDLVLGTRIGYNGNKEALASDKELWRDGFYSFCREGMKGYVNTLTDKPYFLDKSRAWGNYYPLLNNINPNPKILFMVRDLRAIFASMEKKFRSNPDIDTGELNNMTLQNTTTQKRVQHWASTHPVGYALEKLQQSILERNANNFLFLRYEDLCDNPEQTMKDIYTYLDIPYYEHSFDYIEQITQEDDTVYGIYGDHKIRNKLQALPKDFREVLGPYTCDWVYNSFKWYYDTFNYFK
jgi:sulfotransferase